MAANNQVPVIEVQHLKKYFSTKKGKLHAVDDVSFTIESGQTLGVVGESGCGKSTLGRTILRLHEPTEGRILYAGSDITGYGKRQMRELRQDLQMIFQDPYSSINPRKTVAQTIEMPMVVSGMFKDRKERAERVAELMETVGLAPRLAGSYPHELDGGRRQRIGLARALALKPKFIVCDEPVSALDVSIQAQILNLLMDLQDKMGLTYMFITHDMSVVKHISDDIAVMYLGQCVEKCSASAALEDVIDSYRVLESLDSMDVAGVLLSPAMLDVRLAQIVSAAAALQNSTKPLYFTALNRHEARSIIRLMRAAAGGSAEHNGIIYASSISPLFFDDDCFGVIDEAARAGIPMCSLCCPTMGLTAPMSLAGAIAQQNAEVLAFNMIAKLINPDVQVVYGSRLGFANMRDMKRMNGLPEEGVIGASVAQLARYYHMVSDVYGSATRAHAPADVQLGYEKAVCGYLPILAGADMISGIGNMSSGAGTCLECLVIDNDIFSMMFKGARGVDTLSDKCFPTDVIKEVAHEHETFISQEHTVEFLYREELWHGGIGVEFDYYFRA